MTDLLSGRRSNISKRQNCGEVHRTFMSVPYVLAMRKIGALPGLKRDV